MNNRIKWLVGLLMAFGLSSTVMAGSCESTSATFSSSLGSSATCSSISTPLNEPLDGCVVGSGDTSCIYQGTECAFRVNVPAGVGQSQDRSTTYTIDNLELGKPACQAKFAITRGNQSSSYCRSDYPAGTSGDKMTTKSNNGNPVTHRQLEVCTDEKTVTMSAPPVVSIEKTVGREEANGSFDCTDSFDEISVIAGDPSSSTDRTVVKYCYTIRNDGLGRLDALFDVDTDDYYFIEDNNGTTDTTVDDDFKLYDCENAIGEVVTSLGFGESCVAKSDLRTIPNTVERVVNEAIVEGVFQGSVCATCTDSDTATVNVLVQCDADTQEEADETGKVVERLGRHGITRCAPREDTDIVDNGVGLLCNDICAPRPECAGTSPPAHCSDTNELQCKPSGNWYHTNALGAWTEGVPSPGKRPLCSEVLRNITNSSSEADVKNPVFTFANGRSITVRTNPYLYYYPGDGGGNSIGTIYCILYPGETNTVCPSGSIVY